MFFMRDCKVGLYTCVIKPKQHLSFCLRRACSVKFALNLNWHGQQGSMYAYVCLGDVS
jgi:hypothetical protein